MNESNPNYKNMINPTNQRDEIDLSLIINMLFRNKFLVASITSLATISTIVFSYIVKPIWSGSFGIVVKSESNNSSIKNLFGDDSILSSFSSGSNTKNNKTQESILKSPFVLMPVFKYVQEYYSNDNKYFSKSFNKWFKDELDIKFEKGTNVLKVTYENTDKKLIINVLNKILKEYKNYSKSERDKELTNTINYLNEQKNIMTEKSSSALKKLNKFSIDNGLGDIDGFVTLGKKVPNLKQTDINLGNLDLSKISNFENMLNSPGKGSGAGQRFQKQFAALEEYESLYLDLSSKLKENSTYLIQLRNKIDKFRSSLKRPNEILLKYRELKNNAERQESLLINIEDNLQVVKLERIKSPNPWQLISIPTLDDYRVFPRRSTLAIQALILSFLSASIISYIKENISGIIFDAKNLESEIRINFIDTIYVSNLKISLKLISKLISKDLKSSKIGVLNFSSINKNDLNEINDKNALEIKLIDNNKEYELEQYTHIFIFAEEGIINKKDLILLNKLINIYEDKFLGWFHINSSIKLT